MKTRIFFPKPNIGNRGFISADFIFSLVIAWGLCMVLFALTFTLSMVEVGQYIAYSVARAYTAAQADPDHQAAAAQAKFASFQKNKVLSFLFNNGWFSISSLDIRGGGPNARDFSDRYPTVPGRLPQTGIRLVFESKILKMQVPMMGTTDADDKGFKAFLTGLMIREPTSQECQDQIINGRYQAIMALDPRFSQIAGSGSQRNYVPMEDNGC